MRRAKKKGYTLVELLVVLAIMGIILAIAVPSFISYWRKAEFRKNESNAKTIYLAAESKLTYYRSSGQWKQFKKEVKKQGEAADFFSGEDVSLNGRIYAITLDSNEYKDTNKKKNAVLKLLDDYIYDKDLMSGSIGIEINIETGEVYSAFYGTKCKGLTYKDEDADGYLTMQKRDYESRSKRLLGYYSTEDTTNVVSLKPKKLRITTISLHNSEKLSLNWSSNAGYSQSADYEITFYKKDKKTKLFSLVVSPYKMATAGWKGTTNSTANMASLEVKDANGKSKENWTFPVTYSDNKYSLVLDGIMSAKVQEALDKSDVSEKLALERTYSTSICRLSEVDKSLASAQDICAAVKAVPATGDSKKQSNTEWRESESVFSNSANSMYADNSKEADVKIAAFRHLSNIRYYNGKKNATFTLTNKNMDWTAVGTGVYDFVTSKSRANDIQLLAWKENSGSQVQAFPTIATLDANDTLKGDGSKTLISNLKLGKDSIVDGKKYLGLFGEISGQIEGVTLQSATLTLEATDSSYNSVQAAGIIAGRNEGTLKNVSVISDKSKVEATLTNKTQAAVGGVVGIFAGKDGETLSEGTLTDVTMEGTVGGSIPSILIRDDSTSETNIAGIGGIVGYANLENGSNAVIAENENHAEVSGNFMTGGIAGKIHGSYTHASGNDASESQANIKNSSNDGLILCTEDNGKYFGGIIGYGFQTLIHASTSASGRASGFSFVDSDGNPKTTLLKGTYVGGIVGYGVNTLVNNCSTEKDGYTLGADYVGGIAGGLTGEAVSEAIRADSIVSVTTNASYVIGNKYVGGIVGQNANKVTLQNCVNNGVAAGYEKYVGGIVGFNEHGATIENCASYLSDYDNSVFNMIVDEWKATGSYAGGIVGYNNGEIKFSQDSQAITVKSVSSIVVGQDYVGGIAGFNDTEGTLDVNYTLIGGRIYGYGNCVGGGFGLNASTELLTQELTIRPSSVEGKYYVGGCIGANVVNLSENMTMSKFRTDNILGNITGEAYVGGIIGYQRTYGADQLPAGEDGAILDSVENTNNLFPGITDDNVPGSVFTSDNSHIFTVTTDGNSDSSLSTTTNNIPLRGNAYVGGIIGYADKSSHLVIKNCKNAGSISKRSSGSDRAVALKSYVNKEIGITLNSNLDNPSLHLVGGIISANLENHVIDHCTNTGSMSGYSGTGGIVGLNAGLVYNCELSEHFGNAALNYLGGIAGINVGDNHSKTYDSGTSALSYKAGTIQKCSTLQNKTISGKNNVGGIVGWNLTNGILNEDTSYANITSSGNNVGGVAGRNSGKISVISNTKGISQRISSSGNGIGGLVGVNESEGTLEVQTSGTSDEVVAVGTGVSVSGYEKVGGIIGINYGTLGNATQRAYLVSQARQVRATHGTVGGVVGETNGDITKAINRSTTVTADSGTAGGVAAVNAAGKTIADCINYGDVRSSNGYAGGITAENKGTIRNCSVDSKGTATTVIYSLGVDEIGAVSAVNTGTITDSGIAEGDVLLRGDTTVFGGVVGTNEGIVENTKDYRITRIPSIQSNKSSLTVGGVVGWNSSDGTIKNVTVNAQNASAFKDFTDYHYLGGIVGNNAGTVDASRFEGTIREKSGTEGNCYGGIAGINQKNAKLENCSIGQITMEINGVYTATSTSTAAQKESLATHAGGIVGKNEEGATVSGCTLDNNSNSKFKASYGMLGGVTGFNKGTIEMSGSSITSSVMSGADTVDTLAKNATAEGLNADNTYVSWNNNKKNIEDLNYNGSTNVAAGRLQMIMESNGNLGGITAYNGTTGRIGECVSGKWFLNNKSEALGVGTGGIIGMNESEQNLEKLVNGAFVGRQLKNGVTNRFAGGIIGNQNNSTSSDWTINSCINYGTIYCYNTHYSGGIMGQWTGSGGNIKNCRNYGNLQTTYAAGWVGASGGIVAQLYHAYEENEYNIIGCGNFGNIYGRSGENTDNCANDSAGILGNVTAYYSKNVSDGQSYKIQILDCVNGAGVKIYSASMASGILGFFSSDSATVNTTTSDSAIVSSTQNIELRIERCQNYAEKLQGSNFAGGIFGDRYGETGAKNTVIKDCYSMNRESRYYNHNNNPVYSFKNSNARPDSIKAENRIRNYFIQGNGDWDGWKTKVQLNHNKEIGKDAEETVSNALGDEGFTPNGSRKQYAQFEFLMYDKDKGLFFIGTLEPHATVNNNWAYIDADGYIRSKDKDDLVGQVLFYLDESYNIPSDSRPAFLSVYDKMIAKGSNYYKLARESYRRIEGIKDQKILAPKNATATVSDGKVNVEITTQDLPNSAKNEKCDPFKYNVEISDGKVTKVYDLYTENGSLEIPSGMSGNITVRVRSVSMYDDVSPSDWMSADTKQVGKVLPTPDVRVDLVSTNSGTSGSYAYRFSLENKEDYDSYPGWQVKVNVLGGGSVTLNDVSQSKTMTVNAGIYQMTAQASGTGTSNYESSSLSSVPVYLPKYTPSIALQNATTKASPKVEISGDCLDELTVKVSLDGSSTGTVETPPIYRAELIGTWNKESNVVFAHTDILTVANGIATASFTNLPQYISKVNDLKVRIWYAQSGLGPVYTYYDVDKKTEANIKVLETVEDGKESWNYQYSTVLDTGRSYFNNYKYTSDTLFTWLAAPVLDQRDGSSLTPDIDTSGKLKYTFSWDKNVSNGKYEISLTGIDADGKQVTIDTSDYNGGKTYTADSDEWTYTQVRLKVTRIGDASNKQIGLSTTATYNVSQRLERPEQPVVEIVDQNELYYNISWSPISSETNCAGYQAYIRTYDDNGNLEKAEKIGNMVKTSEKTDGSYKEKVNLEDYAGKRAVIYLVAVADASGKYLDSAEGITYELQIPKRLAAPKVTWATNWMYDITQPIDAEKFENGGMTISLIADDASVPPGGSAYLLKAYVYNNKDDAENASISNPGDSIAEYPGGDIPIQMDMINSHNYSHAIQGLSIKFAGKWIVFYARISSGSGSVSSAWTKIDEPVRLSYVKLAEPDVTSKQVASTDEDGEKLHVKVKDNPDLEPQDAEWDATRTHLTWESVDCANLYSIDLAGKLTEDNSTKDMNDQVRVIETTDAYEKAVVQVQQYVQEERLKPGAKDPKDTELVWVWKTVDEVEKDYPEGTEETDKIHTYQLNQYQVNIEDTYSGSKTYTLTIMAELDVRLKEDGGFGYTLKLPDITDVKAMDGQDEVKVEHANFNVTTSVKFKSNVTKNLDPDNPSKAYIESEVNEVKFTNQ